MWSCYGSHEFDQLDGVWENPSLVFRFSLSNCDIVVSVSLWPQVKYLSSYLCIAVHSAQQLLHSQLHTPDGV